MEVFLKFATVVGLGIIELWAAIPAGLALGLNPLLTGLASALGSIVALVFVVLLGDRIRNWIISRRKQKKVKEENSSIHQIWDNYGVIGLGLLSPLITGSPLGAAVGVSLGAPPNRLILWMIIGIVVWTIILTLVSTLGIVGFKTLVS
jgi:uncharacterized membrane protein